MDGQTLKERIVRGEELILLDVRDPEEIRKAPFFKVPPKNYLTTPFLLLSILSKEEIREKIFGVLALPESTQLVILCRSGNRSGQACEVLRRHGWQAENLEGGVIAWGNPV